MKNGLTVDEVLAKLNRRNVDVRTREQLEKINEFSNNLIEKEMQLHNESSKVYVSKESVSKGTKISKDTIYNKPILKDFISIKQWEYDSISDAAKIRNLTDENNRLKNDIRKLKQHDVIIIDLNRQIKDLERKIKALSVPKQYDNTTKIISWNVNGMKRRTSEIQFLVLQEKPDILCLQEIRTQNPIDIPGYIKNVNIGNIKGESGVAIYTKEKPNKITNLNEEGRIIIAEYSNYVIVNVYVPYIGEEHKRLEYRNKFDSDLYGILANINKPVICCGDFNCAYGDLDKSFVDAKKPCQTVDEIRNFNEYIELGFKDNYRYLYPDEQGLTASETMRLDYFLTKKIDSIAEQHLDYMTSDHRPIVLYFEKPTLDVNKGDEDDIKNSEKESKLYN